MRESQRTEKQTVRPRVIAGMLRLEYTWRLGLQPTSNSVAWGVAGAGAGQGGAGAGQGGGGADGGAGQGGGGAGGCAGQGDRGAAARRAVGARFAASWRRARAGVSSGDRDRAGGGGAHWPLPGRRLACAGPGTVARGHESHHTHARVAGTGAAGENGGSRTARLQARRHRRSASVPHTRSCHRGPPQLVTRLPPRSPASTIIPARAPRRDHQYTCQQIAAVRS